MLKLELSGRAGRARISCDVESVRFLQALRGGFASAVSLNNQAFDVDVDDLLVNLQTLAVWPRHDTDFRWGTELLALVETNAEDAATVESRLGSADGVGGAVTASIGGGWNAPLTNFQRRDLDELLSMSHGANLSVPGAGKTRVALAAFQARRDQGQVSRLLVVCPKSAFESWQDEARICFPEEPLRVAVMEGGGPPAADVVLINYERLPDARASLLNWLRIEPAMLILDEAHRMKRGPAGVWGAACLTLGPYAARRMILTGTPAPNGPDDLENLFAFVWPGQGRAIVANAVRGNDLRRASELLKPLFVRTTKGELDLPPVDREVRRVELPRLHRELYNALLGQAATAVSTATRNPDLEALGRVLLYLLMAATTPALLATGASRHEPLPYRVPPLEPPPGSSLADLMHDLPQYELSPKYQEVLAIVAGNAEAGRKTLVWSTFVRNLKSLELLLSRYNPAIVHGGSDDRKEQLSRFREDDSCMVLLSNPATLGEGVSLHHACHDAVYLDRDFAAGRFLQSLDRIHRLGLSSDTRTRITLLVANGTIDELVEQRLAAKLAFMGGVLDDQAIVELGDFDEEPTASVGMDSTDLSALIGYLSNFAART